MNAAVWWLFGALAVVRVTYPRVLERRQAQRFRFSADGVIAGAEPIDLPKPGAPAVLVLHGGGDTPQSMRGVASYLHDRGYAVRAPLLENHGRSLGAARKYDVASWQAQVRSEFKALRAKHAWVAIVGQSVGGALALDLAASMPDVSALVLLAPWVAMPTPLRTLAQTSRLWGWALPYLPSLGGHSIHDQEARSRALTNGVVTPAQMRSLAELAQLSAVALPRVRVPTLTMQSREDERIAIDAAQRAFDKLGAAEKRLEWVTGAGHVISVDFGKERILSLAADWLDQHRKQ